MSQITQKDIAEFISDLIDSHIWTIAQNNQHSSDNEPHISIIDRSADIEFHSWTDDGEILLRLKGEGGTFNINITRTS